MKLNVGELIKKVTSEKSGTRILVAIGTAGLCIIMLSSVFTGSSDDKKVKGEEKKDSSSFCIETEKRLEKFICALEGVSEAEVLITLGSEEELVFAKEGRTIITDEKKEERSSLLEQRKFWNTAINNGLEVRCLYTDKLLAAREYELDHFIPWSFVSHDLLWNLMPADASINSSKSNKLPNLKLYLPKLAEAHQAALRINLEIGRQNKLME